MKSKPRKGLSIGDLIANVYNACGKHQARGILQLAFKSHLVVFREPNRSAAGGGNRKS